LSDELLHALDHKLRHRCLLVLVHLLEHVRDQLLVLFLVKLLLLFEVSDLLEGLLALELML
jgi:hypothetical protein